MNQDAKEDHTLRNAIALGSVLLAGYGGYRYMSTRNIKAKDLIKKTDSIINKTADKNPIKLPKSAADKIKQTRDAKKVANELPKYELNFDDLDSDIIKENIKVEPKVEPKVEKPVRSKSKWKQHIRDNPDMYQGASLEEKITNFKNSLKDDGKVGINQLVNNNAKYDGIENLNQILNNSGAGNVDDVYRDLKARQSKNLSKNKPKVTTQDISPAPATETNIRRTSTHSKSKWRQHLRDNPDKAKSIIGSITASDNRISFTKDGFNEYKDFIQGNSNNIEDTFKYVSDSLNTQANVHNTLNANDIIALNSSNIPAKDKIRKRKKIMGKIKDNKDMGLFEDYRVDPNSDELVTIIHGSSKERISSFLNNGRGAYKTETDMIQKNGQAQNIGFQFHSEFQDRAAGYAQRTGDNGSPAVLVAQVPKKELYFNANGNYDEYMFPASSWKSITNARIYEPGSVEFDTGKFYNDNDLKHVLNWKNEQPKLRQIRGR